MKRTRPLLPLLLAVALVLASCGDDDDSTNASSTDTTADGSATTHAPDGPGTTAHSGDADPAHAGDKATPDRTIEVDMVDTAFKPAQLSVKAGETVRFVFHNRGKLVHEAILGDKAEHTAHEKKMREQGAQMKHTDTEKPIKPGQMIEVTHTFKAGEQLLFGCHLPGHFDAGQVAPITVT